MFPVWTDLAGAAQSQISDRLAAERARLERLAARAARVSPDRRLAQYRQRIDDLARRGRLAIANRLHTQRVRLEGLRLHLAALDPTAVLARGYAIVSRADGVVISSTTQVSPGDDIHVRVADGGFGATVRSA
jgi:exodeoxyribonuclease VII large subunit